MANLGFIIAVIYFIVLSFWALTILFYFIYFTKPVDILPGTTPQIYITIMKSIHNVLSRVLSYVFVIVTVIVVLLFLIWLILKSLPWPMNYLSEIPPLNELRETGIFAMFEKMINVLLNFSGPRQVFNDISGTIIGFLKEFLIKFAEEYNPTLAEKLKQAPGNEMPKPEKSPEKPKDKENKDDGKVLSDTMDRVIEKNIEQCIMKNKIHITNEMSTSEILKNNMMNRMYGIQCQLMAIEPKLKINVTNNIP
tara:strand:- start:7827 stop:8579 length:753 start_codon:yes stop_codon:yes gene_type:complete